MQHWNGLFKIRPLAEGEGRRAMLLSVCDQVYEWKQSFTRAVLSLINACGRSRNWLSVLLNQQSIVFKTCVVFHRKHEQNERKPQRRVLSLVFYIFLKPFFYFYAARYTQEYRYKFLHSSEAFWQIFHIFPREAMSEQKQHKTNKTQSCANVPYWLVLYIYIYAFFKFTFTEQKTWQNKKRRNNTCDWAMHNCFRSSWCMCLFSNIRRYAFVCHDLVGLVFNQHDTYMHI